MPEQNSPILTLTQALAEAFGEGWRAVPSPHTQQACRLAGPDACLGIIEPHPNDHRRGTIVQISTALPLSVPQNLRTEVNRRLEYTHIKVSPTRPANAIRRDIERRILPYARIVHAEALAHATRLQANIDARHRLRDELIARMPGAVVSREGADDNTTLTTFPASGSEVHGTWLVNRTGTSVTATLKHLTPQQAQAIAELLHPQYATVAAG
jgi:hypothetical protein